MYITKIKQNGQSFWYFYQFSNIQNLLFLNKPRQTKNQYTHNFNSKKNQLRQFIEYLLLISPQN